VITISNTGTADLHVSGMLLSDTVNYSLDLIGGSTPCGTTTPNITPSSSCAVAVTFNPSAEGTKNANLTVTSDDPVTPTRTVPLRGTGVPDVTCSFTPSVTQLSRGSTLNFLAAAQNVTNEVQVFQFATRITLPNGNTYPSSGWLIGPITVTLNPNTSKSKSLTQFIPYNAPFGTYTYRGYVGIVGPPAIKYDECQFNFSVNP
jgi:hypothetical protein